ncbi:hypothetical protein ACGLWX_05825 [Halomonas sp. HMF6819]|uniref:hypothetical protein n=1 Tax=Halomonas sp. HMF6819 TaxID=3373085 RepID=UPI0037A1F272
MSTEYTDLVAIAAPEGHIYDANQLALCLGESPYDDQTFGVLSRQDDDGNLYSAVTPVVKPAFMELAAGELKAPVHAPDVDLEAARRAQAILLINNGPARPDRITVLTGSHQDSASDLLAQLRVSIVPADEPA